MGVAGEERQPIPTRQTSIADQIFDDETWSGQADPDTGPSWRANRWPVEASLQPDEIEGAEKQARAWSADMEPLVSRYRADAKRSKYAISQMADAKQGVTGSDSEYTNPPSAEVIPDSSGEHVLALLQQQRPVEFATEIMPRGNVNNSPDASICITAISNSDLSRA